MRIIVCLKEVPSRDTRYEIDSRNQWIKEENVSFEASECDEYALEEGLKLKEKHGGDVVILTLGGAQAEKVIRKGLAMGADRAILIQDPGHTLQTPNAVARALAAALADEEFDLLLSGTQSDDFGFAQTSVMLAEFLQIPHATIVMEVEADVEGMGFKVLREMESGWFQWLKLPMPCLLAVQAGISAIRYPSLKGIMQAKKKEIRKIEVEKLTVDWTAQPRLEIERLYIPEQERRAELLKGETDEIVDQLVGRLQKEAKVL